MRRVRAQVTLAAGSSASVLVMGPVGSGRQRVAETIHYSASKQPVGTLIPLACSVLGSELIESAIRAVAERRLEGDRPGQGTLLLNDVDLLPADVQNRVADTLRVKSFPLRIIGTARRSVDELAGSGDYDADLAALLSTIVIQLPSLADRRKDLPLLAQAFVEEINGRSAKQVSGFSSEALDWLDGYDWPGNIDEFAQMVAKAHERADGAVIEVSDLPQRIHLARKAAAHPAPVEETIVLDEFLDRVQRELIHRALRQAKGNKTKAANLLGMTRPRLYRRLLQLGLEGGPADG
jgi:DNA-binding NtrC family response regulator